MPLAGLSPQPPFCWSQLFPLPPAGHLSPLLRDSVSVPGCCSRIVVQKPKASDSLWGPQTLSQGLLP